MPCDGPRLEDAVKSAEAVFPKILDLLKREGLYDSDDVRATAWGHLRENAIKDEEALKKALAEVIFNQDCVNW